MKLCRFELRSDPGTLRSGVLREHRIYETDGERPIGVHDLGDVALLPPLGRPASIRAFDEFRDELGDLRMSYQFLNPARLVGPNSEIDNPEFTQELDFEVRVVTTAKDVGQRIEEKEAPDYLLGFALAIVLVANDVQAEEQNLGLQAGRSKDIGIAFGSFLTTPDDLIEFTTQEEPTRYGWPYRLIVNGKTLAEGQQRTDTSYADMLAEASEAGPIFPGELLLGPPLAKLPLIDTEIGRGLVAGDRIEAQVGGLGPLVTQLT